MTKGLLAACVVTLAGATQAPPGAQSAPAPTAAIPKPVQAPVAGIPKPGAPAPNAKVEPIAGEVVGRAKDNRDVAFNFSNAKLFDIIQVVAKLEGLNYTIDPALKDGPVKMFMFGKLEKDGVSDVLALALKLNGVGVVRNGDFLEFVPARQAGAAAPMVWGTQPADGMGESFIVTQIIPLRFLDAEGFAAFAKEFASTEGRLAPDHARNVLIVTDYLQNVRRILDFVDLMDKQPFEQKRLLLFRLKNSAPDRVLKELETVLKAADVPVGTGALQIVPVESLNALLVVTREGDWVPDLKGWIERFDESPRTEGGELFVLPLKHAKAESVYPILAQVLRLQASAPPQPAPVRPSPALSQPFGQSPYPTFGAGNTVPSSNGNPTGSQGGSQAGTLGSMQSAAGKAEGTAAPLGGSAVSSQGGGPLSSTASITVDPANNALLVFGTQHDFAIIDDAIRKLDVLPRQVLIEATIMDLNLTGEFEYGFAGYLKAHYDPSEINVSGLGGGAGLDRDWRIDRPDSSGGFTYTLMAGTRYGLLSAVFSAKDTRSNTNLISQPRLWALDNQPARLQVQDQIPIPVNTYVPGTGSGSGSNGYAVTNVQYLDTGLTLTVTPHINGSGVIRLEIEQDISSSSGFETLGSGQSAIQAPRISRRQLSTELIARDGETIVLGGLIQQNKTNVSVGLPILNRIPIIRNLFSSNQHLNQKSELVILLTPHVITTLDDGSRMTQEIRNEISDLAGK